MHFGPRIKGDWSVSVGKGRTQSNALRNGINKMRKLANSLGAWRAASGIATSTVLVLLMSGCSGRGLQQAFPGGDQAATTQSLVHIHGLGVDASTGALFVATHYGLFRMDPAAPTGPANPASAIVENAASGNEGGASFLPPRRVSETTQDIMGFTVAGPSRLLASGHPSVDQMRNEGLPPLLGLLESIDGGKTWQTLSLQGEADFHVIRFVSGRIYGWNSSTMTLMASVDGKGWEKLSELPLFDFAVSPSDPSAMVAAVPSGSIGPSGLVESRDGGRTWATLSNPEDAVNVAGPLYIAWPSADRIFVLAKIGTVFGRDPKGHFRELGSIGGQPVAFLAHRDELFAATAANAILRSSDGGVTWHTLYEEVPAAGHR